MKNKRFIIGIGICFAVVMMLSILGPETVSAEECLLIKVTSQAQPTKVIAIDPQTLEISAGDCVFWANMSKDSVKIRFMGSEECIVNPSGFECEGSKKSFVTGYYGKGQTKSLQIVKAGTYNYEIQPKTQPSVKSAGTIIVK